MDTRGTDELYRAQGDLAAVPGYHALEYGDAMRLARDWMRAKAGGMGFAEYATHIHDCGGVRPLCDHLMSEGL